MKSKLSVALLWILVFLLGSVAGAVSHYLYREHVKTATPAVPPKPKDIVEGLARELKLDAQQRELLKDIFSQSRQRYRALGQEYRPKWEAIRNGTDEQIKQILRADQRAKFEEFLKKVYSARPGQIRPSSSSSSSSK